VNKVQDLLICLTKVHNLLIRLTVTKNSRVALFTSTWLYKFEQDKAEPGKDRWGYKLLIQPAVLLLLPADSWQTHRFWTGYILLQQWT